MYVMGIDIGSASSKAVILKDGRELAASAVVQAGTGGPDRVLKEIFEQSGLKRSDIACITGTGYGRYSLEIADKQVSEISCHAKGIHFMLPNVRTILDIGGQDVKAIAIDENGKGVIHPETLFHKNDIKFLLLKKAGKYYKTYFKAKKHLKDDYEYLTGA